jgi:hypothetical protein
MTVPARFDVPGVTEPGHPLSSKVFMCLIKSGQMSCGFLIYGTCPLPPLTEPI